MYQGLQTSKRNNQFKTWILLLLFPVVLAGVLILVFFFLADKGMLPEARWLFALDQVKMLSTWLLPLIGIWCLISFFFQRQLMFSFSGAQVVTRQQEPQLYNIVENLCISKGLVVPKIGIIETEGINAFALGWRASDSRVVFTRGLLNRLEKREIEAVAAHELTHIINKDSLLMLVMVLYIGAIAVLGEILLRFGWTVNSKEENKINPLFFVGLALVVLGYIFYPLIRLAISRKREFLADAGAVEITRDNQAMISALRKISTSPEVKINNKEMSAMFIANPLGKLTSLFQTHPSIEDRIKALENY